MSNRRLGVLAAAVVAGALGAATVPALGCGWNGCGGGYGYGYQTYAQPVYIAQTTYYAVQPTYYAQPTYSPCCARPAPAWGWPGTYDYPVVSGGYVNGGSLYAGVGYEPVASYAPVRSYDPYYAPPPRYYGWPRARRHVYRGYRPYYRTRTRVVVRPGYHRPSYRPRQPRYYVR
ncbi:MAG TPA: hypothetical protein VNR11_20415 [Xanthobacteraceae bacterium]|nr:hypothetical protein [Xanthobacteraceae bacterium]